MANEITSQNAAQAIVKMVATDALPALVSNLVMGNLVNRSYESDLAAVGDTVNVPIAPPMVASNIAEGGSVTNQNPALGNAQVVLNTHAESTFVITDIAKALASPDLIRTYMDPSVIAVAERIEADLFGLYALLTYNADVGTANTAITESAVDAAERSLFAAKVPEAAGRVLVLSGDGYGDVRQLPRFTEAEKVGEGSAIRTGMVGRLKNFEVFRSQNVKKVGSTIYNLAFARDAFALVTRRLPQPLPGTGAIAEFAEFGSFGLRVVMSYQPNTLSQQFTVDVLYGSAVLRGQFGVRLLS